MSFAGKWMELVPHRQIMYVFSHLRKLGEKSKPKNKVLKVKGGDRWRKEKRELEGDRKE
jgi:hypothetical protein